MPEDVARLQESPLEARLLALPYRTTLPVEHGLPAVPERVSKEIPSQWRDAPLPLHQPPPPLHL